MPGGMFAGGLGSGPAAEPQHDSDERVAAVLADIRDDLRRARASCNVNDCPDVERVRNEQRTFLKGRSKFPDFIDVGAEVWDRVCDWHVKHQLPLQVARMADGRYSMPFFQTFLVLRPDSQNGYVSQGYDR
jgi:hypothetical protein